MDNFSKYIDNIVEKALNEALEAKADQIVSEIAKKVETTEKLHGRQTELDANKNNKIDAGDFKLLRKKKHMKEYTMGDDDLEGVKDYGDFDTDSPNKVGKVKNVGFKYEKKIGKEFNEEDAMEGNEFSGELAKARKSGAKSFTVDGKTYPVKGESKEQRDEFDGRKSKVIGVYSNIDKQRMEEEDKKYGDMYLGIGDYGFYDSNDRQYKGDFDFDYDEEEYDDFDEFIKKYPNQNWFQSSDFNRNFDYRGTKKFWDKYKEIYGGPYKLRKRIKNADDEKNKDFRTPAGFQYGEIVSGKEEMTEKWKGNVEVKQTGQYSDMTMDELDSAIKKLKNKTQKLKDDGKKVPHTDKTKMSQLYFAKRAKKDWPGKGKAKVVESFRLTESEIIDLIEKIVMEQTSKITASDKDFKKVEKRNKEVNDKHIKDTVNKMKEYLKDASEGEYDMEPKNFPQGNGEMKEMPKKAYKASDAVEEYIDDFAYPGMTNLVYDEIKPNDEWIEANIKGSSKTGNAQTDEDGNALGNVVPSELGEKMYKNYKDNVYGAEQMNASYKRYPQPVDQAGESTEEGDLALKKGAKKSQEIFNKLGESKDDKKFKLISEEIKKMKSLVDYNKKTQ